MYIHKYIYTHFRRTAVRIRQYKVYFHIYLFSYAYIPNVSTITLTNRYMARVNSIFLFFLQKPFLCIFGKIKVKAYEKL